MSTPQQQRAFWLRHLHNWHWISSAICLIAMMLFAVTGFTLNHAADIEASPKTSQKTGQVPASLLQQLNAEVKQRSQKNADTSLPASMLQWLETQHRIDAANKAAEWSPEEIYVALPRPGGDAWLRVNLEDGALEYEKTERGVIAYLNDLHKGRNTGTAWSWFIDIFALACLIFCITGLFLLKMHASNRRLTWPLVVAGLVIPMLLSIMFIH
ncbi:PepSY-associated TM helix domain-containing protein [Undibacterium amnicola]|uniref:PepSY-associated TM helix domain-containing protein n=1 Tax=Undibacterium amnicola TaxID=1834038 RepID=A0ABR6XUU0_9BURK|nr:PepSY-associated TM helix domain-containing protein [uncultured Undibacterium sp.]MBC3833260.1 PepSY-associated TM helix domain-containing protein [Undibacterium amnicola]